MAFLTYEQVRPYAKAIKADVLLKRCALAGRSALFEIRKRPFSDAGRDQILAAWADSGAKEGDKSGAPAPRKFTEGWNIDKPDVVVKMPLAYEIPAKGEIEYTYFVIPSGFTEDKWVQQVEVRPSDRTVVHHAVIYLREPGSKWMADAKRALPTSRRI